MYYAATEDQAKKQKAVEDLVGYSQDFGAFLASANPNLPKDVVAGLVKDHILTLKPVIDAQAAGDQPKVYTLLRSATGHMRMIAWSAGTNVVVLDPDVAAVFSNAAAVNRALRTLLDVVPPRPARRRSA